MKTGKLPAPLLEELLDAGPPLPPELLLGPGVGEDACAIDLPAGVLVAATDPITLTGDDVGAFAAVINANDVAVMGVRPRWFLASVMLPAGTRESEVRSLFAGLRTSLADLDVALVGGHTEITEAVVQPVVVGQMLGHAPDGRFVPTGGLVEGDVIIQVGAAPIEGAAVLAAARADALWSLPREVLRAAREAARSPGISVVEPALSAASAGAVALHDPTEGGLATGLQELAAASQVGIVVDESAVRWFEPGVAVCRALGADPWGTLASGALLAGFRPADVDTALGALGDGGWPVSAIGEATADSGVRSRDGTALAVFARDEVARLLDATANGSG